MPRCLGAGGFMSYRTARENGGDPRVGGARRVARGYAGGSMGSAGTTLMTAWPVSTRVNSPKNDDPHSAGAERNGAGAGFDTLSNRWRE